MNSTCLRLFENAPNGIFVTAPDGRYLRVNPALARIYGYSSPADLLAAQPLLHQASM
ncbi:MAG TPA: PAS domain-containing protein [Synechococcales cyanobacterium M55_K2018_004]|nr:PAS domain-containing protein [Synechococcales cyanobacterium M55_K2018_004]